jgi:RNA polymerase sigma factor (sigma-70 family)
MTTTNRRNRNSAELAEIVARDNEALRAYQLYEAHCNQLPQTDIDPARTRVLKRESERAVAQLFGYYESTIYRKARDMGRALFGDLDNEMHDASEAIAREAFADALRCFDMLSGREFHRFLPLVIHRAIYHQLTPTALADVSRIQCSMVVTAINVRDLLTQELGRHPTNPEILDGVLKWYLADSDHKYGGYYAKHSLTWVVRQKAALPELCGDPAKYNQMFELLARLDASVRPAVVVQHHATASLVDTRDMADALSERDLFSEVHNVLAELTPRQRASIVSSNGLAGTKPRTMSEIGADFGVSRETIRRDLLAAERLLNNKHVKARLRRAQGAVPGKPLPRAASPHRKPAPRRSSLNIYAA